MAETAPQTVRIMLEEPPPPTLAPLMLTQGDEAVAEAYGKVQQYEERLAQLDAKLKDLRASADVQQDDLDASTAERAEVLQQLQAQRDVAAMVGAKEVSEVLKDQAMQSRESFSQELRLASDVLIRSRPLPTGHRHRRLKHSMVQQPYPHEEGGGGAELPHVLSSAEGAGGRAEGGGVGVCVGVGGGVGRGGEHLQG